MHPPPVPPHKSLSARFKANKQPAAAAPATVAAAEVGKGPEVALELEFEQLWEAAEEERVGLEGGGEGEGGGKRRRVGEGGEVEVVGRWELSEGDRRAMREQRARCFVI